jgi:hypothetical protein
MTINIFQSHDCTYYYAQNDKGETFGLRHYWNDPAKFKFIKLECVDEDLFDYKYESINELKKHLSNYFRKMIDGGRKVETINF